MFSGFTVASFAWIYYGLNHNLMLFVIVNVIEGLAFAWSYPAKQSFLVQVAPPRWLGSVQGLEQTSLQVAALVGTLAAPGSVRVHLGVRHQRGGRGVARRTACRRAHPLPGVEGAQGERSKCRPDR